MKFTFPALKKFQPKNFEASSRNPTAMAMVTHSPYIIPWRTRVKSLAPRASRYRVAAQFGHRIQKQRNGMISRLCPKNGERPMPAGRADGPPANLIVSAYACGPLPNRAVAWLLN